MGLFFLPWLTCMKCVKKIALSWRICSYVSFGTTNMEHWREYYRNFRTFTRTADYPQRSIFVVKGKNVQQITCTPKPKKIMLLYYGNKNSQTWSDEYSMGLNPVEAPKTFFGLNCDCLIANTTAMMTPSFHSMFLFTKQKIDRIFC